MTDRSSLIPRSVFEAVRTVASGAGNVVVLTGAGISAESGIPTFRGKEGYWTVGSSVYQPQEMATHAMFMRQPEVVWEWYLYRLGICSDAEPNAGHRAVAQWERQLEDRFLLVTQNVDGLHLRAGNTSERTYQIHGNVALVRCAEECRRDTWALSREAFDLAKGGAMEQALTRLRCPTCGGWARPHVLWFDECYDEERFRYQSSLEAAKRTALLIVVGTSGATNLPFQIGMVARANGAMILDINPDPNPFAELARSQSNEHAICAKAGDALPELTRALVG